MAETNQHSDALSSVEGAKISVTGDIRIARIKAAETMVTKLIERNDFFTKEQIVSTEEGREVISQLVAACVEPIAKI